MDSQARPTSAADARRRPVSLALPRFELGAVGPPHAPQAPATTTPAPAWTPTPAEPPPVHPVHAPSSAHGHDQGHGHAHDHAHGHAHAPEPPRPHAQAHAHEHAHGHAHAHAHSHASGSCDGSHGLFDAHQHDWSHLAMQPRSKRMLKLALAVQLAFLVAEVVGGIITNSLALLGDAAHMLADVGALALALLAARLAARAVDARRTWGMPRAEVLAAAVNSLTLVLSCGWIAVEAVRRMLHPETIEGPGLIAIAAAGLVANLLGAWLLAQADRDNVNIRAAMLHLLVDAASSVGVIVAGIVIALGGPVLVDTVASLLIAFVAVRGTWPVLRSSLNSLVDAAPAGVTASDVVRVVGRAPGVTQVHDVHVWEPGPRRIAATAHVLVVPGVDVGAAILDLRELLARELGIDHATLQVAPDRSRELHVVERTMRRPDAIRRAVELASARRPSADLARLHEAVARRASHVAEDGVASPVRLAAGALRDLTA